MKRLILTILTAALISTAAYAQQAVNLPEKNPWLTDSVYPTSHHNPAQTDVSPIAGPTKSQTLTNADVKTVNSVFVSNPTTKRIGNNRIIFISGVNGISKVLATGEKFEQLSYLPYPGWIAMPAWPLDSDDTASVPAASQIGTARATQNAIVDRIRDASLEDIAEDSELLAYALSEGRSAFAVHCSKCHGAGARGSAGYTNLSDDDWLWGGTLSAIDETIRVGIRSGLDDARESEMPPFLVNELLTKTKVSDVAEYVLSFTERGRDAAAAMRGRAIFDAQCSGCHGANARGNQAFGAPNLRDEIWLYGGERDDIVRTISFGRRGVMPAWQDRFGELKLKLLAVYVHSLGGGEAVR